MYFWQFFFDFESFRYYTQIEFLHEIVIIQSAALKPSCWFRYVGDIFLVCNHGQAVLSDFLAHSNKVHSRIQFTIEMEKDSQLAFLDVMVTRKEKGTLGQSVYRKPTLNNRYL